MSGIRRRVQAVEGTATKKKKEKRAAADENGGPITPDGEESPSPAKKPKASKKQKACLVAEYPSTNTDSDAAIDSAYGTESAFNGHHSMH